MAVVEKLIPVGEDKVRQARADLAAALRITAKLGMNEGIDNHYTVRVPGTTDRYFINPKPLHWAEVSASDILIVDDGGKVIEGKLPPARSGVCIHLPISRAHPRGTCVFHLHMPWSTALTASEGGRLEMVHQNSVRFHDDVAYDDDFYGLATEPAEGERMARIMGDKSVLFLANHGVLVAAESIAVAFDKLYFIERACQVQVLAMSTGRPLRVIPDDMIRATKEQFGRFPMASTQHFEALKRIYLDREGSNYAA
ncbi:MAG: class II aldolase/adducin family protein [Alphaproteobacteria bacterium]